MRRPTGYIVDLIVLCARAAMSGSNPVTPPIALTIAGFDPTGGAGIAADLKTFAANHCYGVAAITALTVQNSQATRSYQPVAPELLAEQLACLLADVNPAAVKLGMLANAWIVAVTAAALRSRPAPIVLDPVLHATSGAELLDMAGREAMMRELLPLAAVITPNLAEAALLTGRPVESEAQMADAARALHDMGAQAVVVTGGHLDRPLDLLWADGKATMLGGDRIRTPHTHGTGCTFSAALAANLAHGKALSDAVVQAKAYVCAALRSAYPIGGGIGPLNHLFRLQEPLRPRNIDPAPIPEYTTR
ncbi:MAG: bifunctional hydroxymethylpyrimidine kinase/phosphomethylpyrimidine kinase [Terriglobales bacterium]